nr:hypothetical protein [Pandoravirus massiliensis]
MEAFTPEEEEAFFAELNAMLGEYNAPPESREEMEREARLAAATPGPVSAQQMIEFFRSAGQDPNAPPDVQVEYPDGQLGPARYSLCAEAIAERWGGFTRRLFERMEQERRRGAGTVGGQLASSLQGLALTEQNEHEFYTLGINIAPAPPAISNAVLLPAGPQVAPTAPFVALTPPAARGLERAAIEASNNVMDALGAVADQIARTEGGGLMTIEELEREMLSSVPSSDPLIREGQQRVDEAIAAAARTVANPLVNAIVEQARMESMMGQFPAGAAPAPAQQPALVQAVSPQQADALVTANIEAQQQEAASRRATPVPSPVPAPVRPGARAPSPAQVTAALERAVAQGAIAGPSPRRRERPPAQPTTTRAGRRGALTAPSTPQAGAPAAPAGYPSAPTTPLYALANVIRATGETPDTQALGVASPPVVPATTDGVLQLVEAETRRNLTDRVKERQNALDAAADTLTNIREQLQTERQRAPQLAQVTRTSVANTLAAERVPPEVAQEVISYLQQPGEVDRNVARDISERLLEVQGEAAAAARSRAEAPRQRAPARARQRAADVTAAAKTVGDYSQQIIPDIEEPLTNEVERILIRAEEAGAPVTEELLAIFNDEIYSLAQVAVNAVMDSLNQIAAQEAQAPVGRGAATVTPGAQ